MSHYDSYYEEEANKRVAELSRQYAAARHALEVAREKRPYGWPTRFDGHLEDMLNWLKNK